MAIKNIRVGQWYSFGESDLYFFILNKKKEAKLAYPVIRYSTDIKGVEYSEMIYEILENEKDYISEVPFTNIDHKRLYEFLTHVFGGTRADIQAMFRYF